MNPFLAEPHLFGPLFADPEIEGLFATGPIVAHFVAFERALTLALGETGAVAQAEAEAAIAAIDAFRPDIAQIRGRVLTDGLPVPGLVAELKAAAAPEAVAAIHKGATSQDLIDTAVVLSLKDANRILSGRIAEVISGFERLAAEHGQARMTGRTRMQAALPIRVADRIAPWCAPLRQHLDRLDALRPRLEAVQFAGAVGDRAELGDKGDAVAAAVARRLGLCNPQRAWHAMRDAMAEYAGWLSLVSGTLGKFGQDICLMAQQGVGDVQLSGGGASSAMPHKQNPVLAELLVTLARFNATQVAGMHQALIHEQERSGAAWTLEWMILPLMVAATGKALLVAHDLQGRIVRLGPAV